MNEEVITGQDIQAEPEVAEPVGQTGEDAVSELETLRAEVRRLSDELEKKNTHDRLVAAQLEEFGEVFPSTELKAIPDSVWESVRDGNSLAAAYALYEQRLRNAEARSHSVNLKNMNSSAGRIDSAASEYFTPDEVRAMSREEVRANYSKIMRSMKKWS